MFGTDKISKTAIFTLCWKKTELNAKNLLLISKRAQNEKEYHIAQGQNVNKCKQTRNERCLEGTTSD